MPRLRVEIAVPYALRLRADEYPTAAEGERIEIRHSPLLEGVQPATIISARFDFEESNEATHRDALRRRAADQLLRRTNRLLRWYRVHSRQPGVTELTRVQASPFLFQTLDADADEMWTEPLVYEAVAPSKLRLTVDQASVQVRESLATGAEPPVADLFLLDAEHALRNGRFRESVLFCWSTIDSTFSVKYAALVDAKLSGEWSEGRKFVAGIDIPMRVRMSAMLYLLAGKSLFRERGDGFWEKLKSSYDKRNGIIHRGETANEDDAAAALDVARIVVEIIHSLDDGAAA